MIFRKILITLLLATWVMGLGIAAQETTVRRWLGPEYWANKLQDWQFSEGRIECLADHPGARVRTVFLLTQEMVAGRKKAKISARTGLLGGQGDGWSGFLVGIGSGRLDYRAQAIVHNRSGKGGGIQCVLDMQGGCAFRDHSSEKDSAGFKHLVFEAATSSYQRKLGEEIELTLVISPAKKKGCFDLKLSARNKRGTVISSATIKTVPEEDLLGGIALVSHPGTQEKGTRFWFQDVKVSGEKVVCHPERAWGPIAATLFSLNKDVLKLTAQFMPQGATQRDDPVEYTAARLDYRLKGRDDAWTKGPVEKVVAPAQTALFRVVGWDSAHDYEYQVVPLRASGETVEKSAYPGIIPHDPVDKDQLVVAAFTGCKFVGRPFQAEAKVFGAQTDYGRFSPEFFFLPAPKMIAGLRAKKTDIMFFTGDQYYEADPGGVDFWNEPEDDVMYKWLYWLASFRELTAEIPSIIQVDDHDVYQGNIWGFDGRPIPRGKPHYTGGYQRRPDWVNMVQRFQTGHNPDPYDATPIQQDITVYYNYFNYGRVSFAVLEDRKWKSPPGAVCTDTQLLGSRQEEFLLHWAREWKDVDAKIAVTQTIFACSNTNAEGELTRDKDTNASPKWARDYAVSLLHYAGAFVISGDVHYGMFVEQGLKDYDDGIAQFIVPAVGQWFQRWFDPKIPGKDRALNAPGYTGKFVDKFGNKFRVRAVAHPRISVQESIAKGGSNILIDPAVVKSGYGIVRVDKKDKQFIVECWPKEADPAKGDEQHLGWPVTVAFPVSPAQAGAKPPEQPQPCVEEDAEGGGCVAHFSFDQPSALLMKDSSGYDHSGQVEGAEQVKGRSGQALQFNGSSHLVVNNTDNLNPAGKPWSVAAWVKPEKENGVIIAHGGNKQGYALLLKDGQIRFIIRSNEGPGVVEVTKKLVGTWTHLAGVITEDKKLKIYINGKLAASNQTPGFITKDPYEGLQIGADQGSAVGEYTAPNYFIGLIDEVQLFNKGLSAKEVAEKYRGSVRPE